MVDVWIKLEENAYRNPMAFPKTPLKPQLSPKSSPSEVRDFADKLEAYDEEMKLHREMQAVYHARSAALEAEFRHDLEVAHHMMGHAKADLLYGKAWQMGHSGGLHEVANYYADLVELVL
jgi:hypothetical protein